MHSIGASIYLEVELENALKETSVIQLELEKEFGGTGPHLEVELEKVFQLLWSLLYQSWLQGNAIYTCHIDPCYRGGSTSLPFHK